MSIVLSHQSGLDALRMLRTEGTSVSEMDTGKLVRPSAWAGKTFAARNFDSSLWRWPQPTNDQPLHILVQTPAQRIRSGRFCSHSVASELPAGSILWLDEHASMVCPELLFVQMAETFSFPALVMLGYELCGNFSRSADNPQGGYVVDNIPSATSVGRIANYVESLDRVWGTKRAREALDYVSDYALSVPEAVLAVMYSLPFSERGYGMGPVTLNEHVCVDDESTLSGARSRYPDISFSFCPVGINYDGGGRLDFAEALDAVLRTLGSESAGTYDVVEVLKDEFSRMRAKVVDDNMRNRQLASKGRIVFPVTKEDLRDIDHLDKLTLQLLGCARSVFGVDTSEYEKAIATTSQKRDRAELLRFLWRFGGGAQTMYGKM